jgi:hypothetical protein
LGKDREYFLGSVLFFRNVVPNYSDLKAKLHQMTHKDFNWNPVTWSIDYKAEFLKLKEAICESCTLYAPDYTLQWVGRSDACQYACGIVIYQIAIIDGKQVHQLIVIASHKVSKQAFKLYIHKKEEYAIFSCLKHLSPLLAGKEIIIQTNHQNLL